MNPITKDVHNRAVKLKIQALQAKIAKLTDHHYELSREIELTKGQIATHKEEQLQLRAELLV